VDSARRPGTLQTLLAATAPVFRFYTLEELWRGLTPEEIESDIDIIRSLSSQPDPEGVQRLQSVLNFLRERGPQA
jgi:hypothetical protein